ncbi:Ribosomal protein lysine methyltransferase [Coniosporium tulheliwenetii]|uniref:Ribosomal protein lysine methyltransferase n=1 Tax=Coniosporium tulheliwenetii TaxID=3383036 RepID=A0ACC2YKY9_9PEZI|nr:Ribosomal protein lysine methyltransferase [Cladosporium sp. JES 115]
MDSLLAALGDSISDPEEEAFLVFSQPVPSSNLGFVDSKARILELSVAGRDLTIHQSPTVLASNRAEGTTGAVVWKVTPLFAEWISSPSNILFQTGVLGPESIVLELGCGVSGIVALALAPKVERYIATDQDYVLKLLRQNLAENSPSTTSSTRGSNKRSKSKNHHEPSSSTPTAANIDALALDWEEDDLDSLPALLRQSFQSAQHEQRDVDAVIACDCIYNDALIQPFVNTCAELCALRANSDSQSDSENGDGSARPTVCVVAQQVRSAEVFEAWLEAFVGRFRVWRVPDELLTEGLRGEGVCGAYWCS